MRFESFRDGIEDLELLYLLQQLTPDNLILKLNIVNDIEDYNEDIEKHIKFRRELFTALRKAYR